MAKAVATSTMIRPVGLQAGTIYLPEIHHKDGNYFPETQLAACGMADVAGLIASGELERVVRVLAVSVGGSECWDASSAVAARVLSDVLAKNGAVPAWCEAFLEAHLGVHNVRESEAEHRQAA